MEFYPLFPITEAVSSLPLLFAHSGNDAKTKGRPRKSTGIFWKRDTARNRRERGKSSFAEWGKRMFGTFFSGKRKDSPTVRYPLLSKSRFRME
ncbi:hypothetical protein B4135_1153 [Caldibacillus debilis]|uniref:Uncharacterized protein n=1 Tax=Caldibacillus debilis TaxID=301148 RepID=A0A150MDN7_9BACI|nr:hypothetical protein B4135_1153 [Caldibacillus debilis]